MISTSQARATAALSIAVQIGRIDPNAPTPRIANVVDKLQRLARSLHKRYEAACSYEWANTPEYERKTERTEEKAAQLARTIPGLVVEHQRDPRGWPLILKMDGAELGRLG